MLSFAFFNKHCNAFHHTVCCSRFLRCKGSSLFWLFTPRFSHRPASTRRDREPGSNPPDDKDGRTGHAVRKRPGVEEDVLAARGSHWDQYPARPAVGAQTWRVCKTSYFQRRTQPRWACLAKLCLWQWRGLNKLPAGWNVISVSFFSLNICALRCLSSFSFCFAQSLNKASSARLVFAQSPFSVLKDSVAFSPHQPSRCCSGTCVCMARLAFSTPVDCLSCAFSAFCSTSWSMKASLAKSSALIWSDAWEPKRRSLTLPLRCWKVWNRVFLSWRSQCCEKQRSYLN